MKANVYIVNNIFMLNEVGLFLAGRPLARNKILPVLNIQKGVTFNTQTASVETV